MIETESKNKAEPRIGEEQLLFGSISSKIVNHASNCTVWVVSWGLMK